MNCLKCAGEISDSYIAEWAASIESKFGVFKCPKCHAAHLRRLTSESRVDRPDYEFRLWGHPASTHRIQRFEATPKPVVT
jgi:hypothetical protein